MLRLVGVQIADTTALQNYYRAGYAIVRQYCPQCFVVINPREFELTGKQWQNFMSAPPYYKVLQDLHRRGSLPIVAFFRFVRAIIFRARASSRLVRSSCTKQGYCWQREDARQLRHADCH